MHVKNGLIPYIYQAKTQGNTMDINDKKVLAEKLHKLMMEMNNVDENVENYSSQSSIFGDLYNALNKIDIVNLESTINSGELIYNNHGLAL